jgi:hypothetical protein
MHSLPLVRPALARINQPRFSPLLAATIVMISVIAWSVTEPGTVIQWMEEGGTIEAVTVQLYFVAAIAAVSMAWFGLAKPSSASALAVVMIALAGREMDWHISFTGTSMLRVSYYYGQAPVLTKLASLAVLAMFIGSALLLLARHGRALLRALARRSAAAVTAVTVLVLLAVTKLVDRSVSVLAEVFGVHTGEAVRALQLAVEEPLELGLPMLVLVGLCQVRLAKAG